MAINLKPLSNWVVVKPIEREEKTKSGIYLPDTAKEKPQEGEVLAVGPGRLNDEGKRLEMDGGTEFKVEDEDIMILRDTDILAKKSK